MNEDEVVYAQVDNSEGRMKATDRTELRKAQRRNAELREELAQLRAMKLETDELSTRIQDMDDELEPITSSGLDALEQALGKSTTRSLPQELCQMLTTDADDAKALRDLLPPLWIHLHESVQYLDELSLVSDLFQSLTAEQKHNQNSHISAKRTELAQLQNKLTQEKQIIRSLEQAKRDKYHQLRQATEKVTQISAEYQKELSLAEPNQPRQEEEIDETPLIEIRLLIDSTKKEVAALKEENRKMEENHRSQIAKLQSQLAAIKDELQTTQSSIQVQVENSPELQAKQEEIIILQKDCKYLHAELGREESERAKSQKCLERKTEAVQELESLSTLGKRESGLKELARLFGIANQFNKDYAQELSDLQLLVEVRE